MNTKTRSTSLSDAAAPHINLAHLYHLLLSKAWVIILFIILSLGAAIGVYTVGSENLPGMSTSRRAGMEAEMSSGRFGADSK